jgi:hypothetical protein
MNLLGSIIKISFSDCSKRREIIGDEPGYELTEKTCKLLHISLNKNSVVAPENVLRDLFRKYGNIKSMHIKSNPGFRPTIYLEYTRPDEAENAINNLVTLDHTGERRKLIGDPSCDINYYFKKKSVMMLNDINNGNINTMSGMLPMNMGGQNNMNTNFPQYNQNMNPMVNPMMYNQMAYMMMYRQQMMNSMNMNNNNLQQGESGNRLNTTTGTMNNPISNIGPQSTLTNPLQPNQPKNTPPIIINFFPNGNPQGGSNTAGPLTGSTTQQGNVSNTGSTPMMPNAGAQMRPMIPPMMYRGFPMMNNMMRPNQGMYPGVYPNTTPQPTQQPQNRIKDLIQEALSDINNNDNSQDTSIKENSSTYIYEKEFSLEDENLNHLWSGFITKNKKDRVGVDAYQIRNECNDFFLSEFNLNVSQKGTFEDIMKRPILGIVAFSPQNETQCDAFNEYITYFKEKQRVGFVNMRSGGMLFIMAPCDFSRKFYQNPKKHLLGIFVNQQVEAKTYVDMNNLSLPPPVISLTEKRLLLKKNKKDNSTVSTQDPQELLNHIANLDSNKIGNFKYLSVEALGELLKQGNIDENTLNMLFSSNPQLKNALMDLNNNI